VGRNIQKGLWLALAGVLALVYSRHASTHEPAAPEPARGERVATPLPPGARRLPPPMAAPPTLRPSNTSLRACHLRGRVTNPSEDGKIDVDLFRVVARSNELLSNSGAEIADDGSFDAELPPGDYFVFARDEERSSPLAGPFSLGLGEEVSEVELTLEDGGSIEGLVVNAEGDPSSASLDVVASDGTWRMHLSASVGEDGTFELDKVPHERLLLTALNAETGSEARMTLAAPERGLILRLSGDAPKLTVHVHDAQGQPATSATVEVDMVAVGGAGSALAIGGTDENGDYVTYPRGQQVRVMVHGEDGIADPVDVELDIDRELDITLKPGGSVRGRVRFPDGSVPRGMLQLARADRSDERMVRLGLEGDGSFEASQLPAGKYLLLTVMLGAGNEDPDEDRSARYRRLCAAYDGLLTELQLADGETLDLGDLRVAQPASIHGVVRAEDGSPIAGAMIEHVAANERHETRVRTDDEGRFELNGLVGSHRLRANKNGSFSSAVTAQSGDTNVVLTVRTVGQMTGIVRGMPAGPAAARCGDELWRELEEDGSIQLACIMGSPMEVMAGGETHHYAVNVDPTDTSYFELKW
jgi:protocatechuate 3,4-dioxygenase beta subunit